ncbi:MAG: hypothetical protein P8K78_10410 [Pirellulales bacterium]|nr:hypothetical protein [Pirellulales bacterium]
MQIVFLHYHLLPGGVTQVIANHLQSLKHRFDGGSPCKIAIFHGGEHGEIKNLNWVDTDEIQVTEHVITGLGYDRTEETVADQDGLADNICKELESIHFAPEDSIIHAHNHALGKNILLPGALRTVAARGYPLLFQIHDFAEDFREDQYVRITAAGGRSDCFQWIYPQANHIHYAVLNRRDHNILIDSGISSERLHVVPNPIVDLGILPDRHEVRSRMSLERGISSGRPLVIYPVRGIRRKNMGEMILWSAMFGEAASFGHTLSPHNVAEKPSYDRWKTIANDLRLPCHFELGETFSFEDNLSAADALITTSVAEGFGMVFLESQLAERPLIGRNLPEITSDFRAEGIDYSLLYDALLVPVDFLGKDQIYESVFTAYIATIEKFGFGDRRKAMAHASLTSTLESGTIDFSRLTPALQQEVVMGVAKDQGLCATLREQNPQMEKSLSRKGAEDQVKHNASLVRSHFAPEVTGKTLENIYRKLSTSTDRDRIEPLGDAEKILDHFIDFTRFCPLRSLP